MSCSLIPASVNCQKDPSRRAGEEVGGVGGECLSISGADCPPPALRLRVRFMGLILESGTSRHVWVLERQAARIESSWGEMGVEGNMVV